MDSKKAFLKRRLRFFLAFSILIVIILSFGFLFDSYEHPQNAAEFLSFFSLGNLYIYTLTFVYFPSSAAQATFERNFEIAKLEDEEDNIAIDFNEPKPKPKVDSKIITQEPVVNEKDLPDIDKIKMLDQLQNLDNNDSDTESM